MAKKNLRKTPKSKIKAALRMLSLRSRERAFAIKRDNYSCQVCGVKQSRKKGAEIYVEVHHKKSIPNWSAIYEAVYKYLLIDPDEQTTLCKPCHEEQTDHGRNTPKQPHRDAEKPSNFDDLKK